MLKRFSPKKKLLFFPHNFIAAVFRSKKSGRPSNENLNKRPSNLSFYVSPFHLSFSSFFFRMTSSSTTGITLAAVSAVVNATVTAAVDASSTESSPSVIQAPSEPIFLQTKLAQGIAGTFVWAALFVTCQQVILHMEWNGVGFFAFF